MRSQIRFLLAMLSSAACVLAQDEPFRISVDAAVVSVQVRVEDQHGRAIVGLTERDFQVFEDDELQPVRYFVSAESSRSMLLLFDTSPRTQPQRQFMLQALNAFLVRLRSQDQTAVAAFGEQFSMLMDWRGLPVPSRVLDRRIESGQLVRVLNPDATPNLYAALEMAASQFANQRGPRGLIVMTDGRDAALFEDSRKRGSVSDLATDATFQQVAAYLARAGVPLFFIAIGSDRNIGLFGSDYETAVLRNISTALAGSYLAGVRLRMERLAELTGGRVLYPLNVNDIILSFETISRELGLSYSIGYAPLNPAADGKIRRIEVRVGKQGARVTQSRNSYVSK
jgi:VWFA-related protein